MFHDRQQFYMGIAHIFYILSQLYSQFPVIVELGANDIFPVFVLGNLFSHPGT